MEECVGREGERVRERVRERESERGEREIERMHSGERVREKALWLLLLTSLVENSPANGGDMDSIPGSGRSYMPWSS